MLLFSSFKPLFCFLFSFLVVSTVYNKTKGSGDFFFLSCKAEEREEEEREDEREEERGQGISSRKKRKKTPVQAIAILDLLRLRLLRPIVILNGSPPGAVPVTAVVVGCVSTTPRGAEAAPPGAWTRPSLPTPPLDD